MRGAKQCFRYIMGFEHTSIYIYECTSMYMFTDTTCILYVTTTYIYIYTPDMIHYECFDTYPMQRANKFNHRHELMRKVAGTDSQV